MMYCTEFVKENFIVDIVIIIFLINQGSCQRQGRNEGKHKNDMDGNSLQSAHENNRHSGH